MTDARRGNGFVPELTQRLVSAIEAHLEELGDLASAHKEACHGVRELIGGVYEAAKEAGIPKAELKAVVKERVLRRKMEACRGDLDDMERRETFDQLKLALGMLSDMPLGETALGKHPDAPAADPNAEAARHNAEALRAGIKPTPAKSDDYLDDLSDIADAVA